MLPVILPPLTMKDVLSKEAIDYALLPIDGFYNMDPQEASVCAAVIGAVHTIPFI